MEPQNIAVASSKAAERKKLLISVLLLTIIADILTYGNSLGAGMALLCGFVWMGLRANRLSPVAIGKDWLLFVLLGVSAMQIAIEPSFSNALVLFVLTVYVSGHFLQGQIVPYWRRALEGVVGFLNLQLALFNLRQGCQDAKNSIKGPAVNDILQQGRRWALIALPAASVAIPFLILFGKGNPVLGEEMKNAFEQFGGWLGQIKLPSFIRITFWLIVAFLLLALFSKSPQSQKLEQVIKRFPCGWPDAKDLQASIWSTRILLIFVNVIFFTANSVDVFYLWRKTELPKGINFSEYVHQGVYNLILCVVLAASILLITFLQDKRVTEARGLKLLAHIWIAQNFLLVSSVLLRLKLYVDTYHLSLLRLYVAFFLLLVVIGFIFLAIKIHKEREFVWLVNVNLLAVFFLFFFVQLINDRAFVAQYNYDQVLRSRSGVRKLDINYLVYLGPPAWPVLQKVADDFMQFGRTADLAKEHLEIAAQNEQDRLEKSDWRSWQYRRWLNRRTLPGLTRESLFSQSSRTNQK